MVPASFAVLKIQKWTRMAENDHLPPRRQLFWLRQPLPGNLPGNPGSREIAREMIRLRNQDPGKSPGGIPGNAFPGEFPMIFRLYYRTAPDTAEIPGQWAGSPTQAPFYNPKILRPSGRSGLDAGPRNRGSSIRLILSHHWRSSEMWP